MAVII